MRWLNPAALAGLLLLAVPIFVHLFGRKVARQQRFPSLRLLDDARPTPATRRRPSDVLLLVLRCGVVGMGALALAQPLLPTAARTANEQRPVRFILVDTSASVRRVGGGSGLELARTRTRLLADSARNALIVETDYPGRNVAAGASWLERYSGLREIVVVSDFQVGSMHDAQAHSAPPGIGLRLERVAVSSSARTDVGAVSTEAGVRFDVHPDRTTATWLPVAVDSLTMPRILASADELENMRATIAAVHAVISVAPRGNQAVAMVFPDYPARDDLMRQVSIIDQPWQGDRLLALRRNRVLTSLARDTEIVADCNPPGVAVMHNDRGQAVATTITTRAAPAAELVVFSCVRAGSLPAAALMAAIVSAGDSVPSMLESEPAVVTEEVLRAWERPATLHAPRGTDETSPDGRWFWLVALALLLLEEWVRRRHPRGVQAANGERSRERVA
jgi:hypothetical protein